jgi:hypothetical protein
MSPDLGDGRPRSNSGKGKSLFNNGPLNKLFQRKTSDRSDHEDVGLTVTHISGPIMIPDGNESMVRPVMPMFSPTPSQDEFGVLHNTNNSSVDVREIAKDPWFRSTVIQGTIRFSWSIGQLTKDHACHRQRSTFKCQACADTGKHWPFSLESTTSARSHVVGSGHRVGRSDLDACRCYHHSFAKHERCHPGLTGNHDQT